tara:strand:- start:19460 stop:20488 length:1029 start_codon:yes stop_codon:yes gene_type:complete
LYNAIIKRIEEYMSKEERLVEDWCFEKDLENEGWMNNGDNGNAYATSDEKVVKMTSDYNEFMQTFEILDNDSEYLPKVFDMRVFPSGELGIMLEYLDTSDSEELFRELEMEAGLQEVDIMNIDVSIGMLSDEARKFGEDIQKSMYAFKEKGIYNFDIQPDNIGKNEEGNYVLFDQTNKEANDHDEDLFEDIKNKLRERYELDETVYKEDVSLEKLSVDVRSMRKALEDVSSGKISRTEGALTCMYNEYGRLQLVDGFHRLCEKLLQSEEVADIEIEHDERTGYSSPVYAITEPENELEIDVSLPFCGLEELACEDTLNDYCNEYLELKNKENKNKTKSRLSF